jgi:hypothetical protein
MICSGLFEIEIDRSLLPFYEEMFQRPLTRTHDQPTDEAKVKCYFTWYEAREILADERSDDKRLLQT